MTIRKPLLASLSLFAFACGGAPAPEATPPVAPTATPPAASHEVPQKLDRVSRADFNQRAAELALPLFWGTDANANGALDPNELAVYWGIVPGATLGDYVAKDAFTPKMIAAYEMIAHAQDAKGDPKDADRQAALKKELAQSRATLVATDLSGASDEEKKFVRAMLSVSEKIEKLYAKQEGTIDLATKVPETDRAARAVFFRNQGPRCAAPLTEKDPNCNAIVDGPKGKLSGLYPSGMLTDPKFCDTLAKNADKSIMDPFTVVEGDLKAPKSVPYHVAYKADVEAISAELASAAEALGSKEPSLKAYLVAASKAFLDDNWWPADEAWAKMDAKGSKYYLRVGPDEVYREPCSTKSLFHVSFGLVNKGSLAWQTKLDPLKTEMEKTLAALAGAPYKAREVSFKLPDFVDIALNAGDSRPPSGATIGQSLPNFGPVANEGRGRTVVMTNFYTDPDSIVALKSSAESLLCTDTMSKYTTDPSAMLMSTVLHEAAHNLGPAHQYKVNGKIDREVFGGPLASTLEELKAQTSALFFTDWLVDKKQVTREDAEKAHVRDVMWGFGHISRGMYDDNKHPKNYSQLAAIQLGSLMKAGAIAWKAEETAANGKDKGCFSVVLDKFQPAVKQLMTEVAQVKGKGDKARAEVWIKTYVDAADKTKLHATIAERMLRAPKSNFVYSVKLDK